MVTQPAKKVQISNRDGCRACGGKKLQKFLSLPAMPFTDEFVTRELLGTEFRADIDIYVCTNCFTVQTQHDVDVTDYYADYQYSVGASPTATAFMNGLADATLTKYFPQSKSLRVLEVGSGDGGQLLPFKARGCEVLGYEPSSTLAKVAEGQGIATIQGLFTASSLDRLPPAFRGATDVVVLSYTFDHLPDPVSFVETVSSILDPKRGLLIVEVHDLELILARREYCLFEHEHSVYLTKASAQELLHRVGFEIIDFDIVPDSIRRANSLLFIAAPKGSEWEKRKLDPIKMPAFEDLAFYSSQARSIEAGIENLEAFVESKKKQGRTIAGYGAGGRGVMTLAAMKNASQLAYLVDKKPKAAGIFAPGSGVPVFGIEKLHESPVDEIIVFSFGYMREIQADLAPMGYRPVQLHSMLDILDGKVLA